jgi:selenocysteine-specific elongation factor
VLDVAPPALAKRGAAAAAGRELAAWPDPPSAADLLRRHGLLRAGALAAMGATGAPPAVAGGWLADPARWARLRGQLAEAVAAHATRNPLAIGMPPEAARAALGLPDRTLIEALANLPANQPAARAGRTDPAGPGGPADLADPVGSSSLAGPSSPAGVRLQDGYLQIMSDEPSGPAPQKTPGPLQTREPAPSLPPQIVAGVRAVLADLAGAPFVAPEAGRLRDLGLDARAIAAAARAGLLFRVTEQIVLAPGADAKAAQVLARLPQPFTTAEARQALGTTRRVAIPLLEYLDRAGITQRLLDDRRRLRLTLGVSTSFRAGPAARGAAIRCLQQTATTSRGEMTTHAYPSRNRRWHNRRCDRLHQRAHHSARQRLHRRPPGGGIQHNFVRLLALAR